MSRLVLIMSGMLVVASLIWFCIWGYPAFWPGPERCLGYPLPNGSRVIAKGGFMTNWIGGGRRYIVIEMSESQFEEFKTKGRFAFSADIAKSWKMHSRTIPEEIPWVRHNVKEVLDEFAVCRDIGDTWEYARWENGRLCYIYSLP